MSSMFKKKGAPAFKPKIPSARPRAAVPAPAPVPIAKPVETPIVTDDAENVVDDTPSLQNTSDSLPKPQRPEGLAAPVPSPSRKRRRSSAASTSKTIRDAAVREVRVDAAGASVEAISEDVPAEAQPPSQPAKCAEITSPTTRRQTRQGRASQVAQSKPAVEAQQLETPPATEVPVTESTSESQAETPAEAAPAAPVPKTTRTRRKASTATAATGEDNEASAVRPRKRTKKAAANSEATPAAAKTRKRSKAAETAAATGEKATPRPRRARSATPEDSESKTVDLQALKMSDLTRDLHIGKKFSRHDELRERERKARMQAKLSKAGLATNGDGSRSGTPLSEQAQRIKAGTPGSATPGAEGDSTPSGGGPGPAGPQFRIVDGQIVVDQSSLVMDRHARAAAAQAGEDMETIEENDFTRLITSSSYMTTSKLKGPNIWTDDETELFYRGLRMFGTDFQMVAHMFPGKQRRHVKLKFNREERCNAARIDAALTGEKTIKMDLEEYKTLTGAEFESVESIMAEQRRIEEGYEAERKRVADEQAEIMRRKREELFADDGDGRKKGKKKGKQTVEYGLNGEPIVNDGLGR